jgi:hypothetical protein
MSEFDCDSLPGNPYWETSESRHALATFIVMSVALRHMHCGHHACTQTAWDVTGCKVLQEQLQHVIATATT